jgi:hypothetical protein
LSVHLNVEAEAQAVEINSEFEIPEFVISFLIEAISEEVANL